MGCLNRFLPGGLAPGWDGLGQVARQRDHPPVRHSAKRVELRSTRFALVAERTVFAAHRGALGTRTPVRSERHSGVHSECDSVRRRHAYRPTETDGQVCLDEVSFEQAVVMLDGPAFVHQGRKSPCRIIDDERHSSPR
ncbi:MAG: hypothetical protein JWQ42_2643, partial [Edaphobacter sp.]|nr:hypothetical protein [Edaphobacter sp.]